MRITIELTESESQAITIQRQAVAKEPMTSASTEAPPIDGGPPPEALLQALGEKPEITTNGKTSRAPGDAGEPPRWLVDAIAEGGLRRSGN